MGRSIHQRTDGSSPEVTVWTNDKCRPWAPAVHTAYLEPGGELLLCVAQYKLNIAPKGDTRGDFDATIQHPQKRAELRIFNNAERPVPPSNPQDKLVAEASVQVRRTRRKSRDGLRLRSIVRVAGSDVAEEVARRVIVRNTIQMKRRFPNYKVLAIAHGIKL